MKPRDAVIIVAACAASPSFAAGKPPVIDPAGTYVLVEIANQKDMVFAGTKMPGSMVLARYDDAHGDIRGGYKAPESALPKGEILRVPVSGKPLVKGKTSRLYLVRIVPDLWVIEGTGNTSFSLGSLTFTAKAGEIIDLGVAEPSVDWAEGEGPTKIGVGSMLKMTTIGGLFGGGGLPDPKQMKLALRARAAGDLALPKELTGRTFTAPQLAYGATFGNYAGGLINRIDGRAGRGRVADPAPAPVPTTPAP